MEKEVDNNNVVFTNTNTCKKYSRTVSNFIGKQQIIIFTAPMVVKTLPEKL